MAVDVRMKIASIALATIEDEAQAHTWTYRAIRPMTVPPAWKPGQKVEGDCSKYVQYLCRWAKAPDPMNNDWGPYGNSQTIWLTLQHLDNRADLLVGDPVTFGHDGDEHAAIVIEAGADPLVASFGHQGAPNSYRLSQDAREQQYLRLPVAAYVPTPDDRLRARTGWFAWVAWRLGEGDWAGRGKANSAVRPAVPRVIPPGWWKRYAAFVANRKKGTKPSGAA